MTLAATPAVKRNGQAARPISTTRLNVLLRLHLWPINVVVSDGPLELTLGVLVLRLASHLDAFSGYLFRTWIPGNAAGATTGTPEVRPPWSSRTKGRSSQDSYTRGR
jgi:hypothetical protein